MLPSSHCLHIPYQYRAKHFFLRPLGRLLGRGCGAVGAGAVEKAVLAGSAVVVVVVVVKSLQPNQPGVSHVEVLVRGVDVVVTGGVVTGAEVVVVVGSLQPNQPGVLQVDVELEVVLVDELVDVVVVGPEVVDSSKQPHHPGVLHVSVLVRVLLLVDELVLVMGSLPLLSKNFQLKQSEHSVSSSQLGTVSYCSSTSLITLLILCVPMPTRHPRSPTVS